MTEMNLLATPRSVTGKGAMRKLRRGGIVPGVVYGLEKDKSLPVQLDMQEAQRTVQALHGSERLISLRIQQDSRETEKSVLLKEVQTTPLGGRLLHLDFYEVNVKETVQVAVEVHPDGKAAGEKMGGILQQVTREISIECLPTAIPEFLPLAVSELEIGQSLHVSDLVLPEGIKVITPEDETLFVMAAPRVEEEPVEEELEEGLEEVEGEGAPEEAPAEEEESEEA